MGFVDNSLIPDLKDLLANSELRSIPGSDLSPYPVMARGRSDTSSSRHMDESGEYYTASSPSQNSIEHTNDSMMMRYRHRNPPAMTPAKPRKLSASSVPWNVEDPHEWTNERVLHWLKQNQFSQQWIDKFAQRKIGHEQFLELSSFRNFKELRLGLSESPTRFLRMVRSLTEPKPAPFNQPQLPSQLPSPFGSASNMTRPTPSSSSSSTASPPAIFMPKRTQEKFLFLGKRLRPTRAKVSGPSVLVTVDNLNFSLVNITSCQDSKDILRAIAAHFGITATDRLPQAHLTDYFCIPGEALSEKQLWDVLSAASGDIAKFYVDLDVFKESPGKFWDSGEDTASMRSGGGAPFYPRTPSHLISNASASAGGDYFTLKKLPADVETTPNRFFVASKASQSSPVIPNASSTPTSANESYYDASPSYPLRKDSPEIRVTQVPNLQHADTSIPRSRSISHGSDAPLIPMRTAPKPPLARRDSARYRPELSPVTPKHIVPRKEVSSASSSPHGPFFPPSRKPSQSSPFLQPHQEGDVETMWESAPELDNLSDEGDSEDGLWAKQPEKTGETGPLESPRDADILPATEEPVLAINEDAQPASAYMARPPTEILLDNLEKFFPNTDLDKPIIQQRSSMRTSPRARSVDHSSGSPVAEVGRMKSIRHVAREASRRIRSGTDERSSLLRRKSTKMWGQRVVEMRRGVDPITLREQPEFVWVRGELLGRGTFGKVYLALNITTGELIAVKQVEVVHGVAGSTDKTGVTTLHAEVETMKDLDHLNIVQYLGYEEKENVHNLFLEYVPGGSVKSILNHFGRFPEENIRNLTLQVVEGLAYLHSQGILHRDLKADNMLLDINGTVKISDFGISKRSRDIYSNNAEMSMQGTIFWMAPEVIHNVIKNKKQGYSAKVDVWSLGCVILEMYAGRRPWSTEEAVGAMYKLGSSKQAPPIPEDTVPYVSDLGRAFLMACFIVDPGLRPTASDLKSHKFCELVPQYKFSETDLGKFLIQSTPKRVHKS